MMPIALLMIEHRQIERMIPVLLEETNRARSGKVDGLRIDALVDFIREYADRCHHGKEEDILFAALRDKRMPSELEAIMERLIEDHKTSRANVRLVIEANEGYRRGRSDSLERMADALELLANLYPRHIATEDKEFFIPSMALFSKDEQRRMLAQFQSFDRNVIHQIFKARINLLAGEAKAQTAVTKPSEDLGMKWKCTVCDHVYDPARGDPEHGIAPGTNFRDLPADWVCPLCGAAKADFKPL